MPLYRYVKSVPRLPRRRRGRSRVVSFLFIVLGGGILMWSFWPIISFSITSGDLFAQTVTPIQDGTVYAASDLSNPNAWFPTAPQKKTVGQVNTYTLSIPKLKIQDAMVTIAGDVRCPSSSTTPRLQILSCSSSGFATTRTWYSFSCP